MTVIALVVGPIEPATKRSRPGVERCAAASRAISAARRLISSALSARPYSASTSGVPPNVFVSTMSAPAARYSSCIRADDVGPRQDQVLVAALELRAAEVLRGQVLALHPGARGAVEHEDALGEELLERLGPFALGAAVRRSRHKNP